MPPGREGFLPQAVAERPCARAAVGQLAPMGPPAEPCRGGGGVGATNPWRVWKSAPGALNDRSLGSRGAKSLPSARGHFASAAAAGVAGALMPCTAWALRLGCMVASGQKWEGKQLIKWSWSKTLSRTVCLGHRGRASHGEEDTRRGSSYAPYQSHKAYCGVTYSATLMVS